MCSRTATFAPPGSSSIVSHVSLAAVLFGGIPTFRSVNGRRSQVGTVHPSGSPTPSRRRCSLFPDFLHLPEMPSVGTFSEPSHVHCRSRGCPLSPSRWVTSSSFGFSSSSGVLICPSAARPCSSYSGRSSPCRAFGGSRSLHPFSRLPSAGSELALLLHEPMSPIFHVSRTLPWPGLDRFFPPLPSAPPSPGS